MKVVIVDDEPDGIDVLVNMLGNIRYVTVVETADNLAAAYDAIVRNSPDLVFLDVEMSDEHGFDLLTRFDPIPFKVIFVTAYDKYAIKAIKFSALDYLLKPVDPDELVLAIEKVARNDYHTGIKHLLRNIRSNLKSPRLAVPSVSSIKYIDLDTILRFQAEGNYTEIYLTDGSKLVSTRLLKEYEDMVRDYNFLRVHRSHLICLNYVDQYFKGDKNTVVMTNGEEIEISRKRKLIFLEKMGGLMSD